jgi:molybdate transport system substrate-binding protein
MISFGVLIGALACGCSSPTPPPTPSASTPAKPAAPDVLRIAAASDLQVVLPELIRRFRADHPIDVSEVYGASGQLTQQIEQGAPYDLFLSANQAYVRKLATEGLVEADSVRPYAHGVLVLVVNRAAGVPVEGLADLARPEVKKIAIANPAVAPYGAAAREALERAELAEAVGPRIVQAETVRQAMQFVQTGNAEAGLVAHSVAQVPEVRVLKVDSRLYSPVIQALGVITRSPRKAAAEEFARFLLGAEGQKIFESFGFKPPGEGVARRALPVRALDVRPRQTDNVGPKRTATHVSPS